MEDNKDNNYPKTKKTNIIDIVLIVLIVLCVAVITLRLLVFARVEILQESMMPTYHEHDIVWVNKTKQVERGSVVVFEDRYNSHALLIKRVVATEGDKLYISAVEGGYVVNVWCSDTGEVVTEDYYYKDEQPVLIPIFSNAGNLSSYGSLNNSYVVPEGHFYAMGDNRAVSNDSRHFGTVSMDSYVGSVME